MTGPALEPEVWAEKGPGPQPGSGQRLGQGQSLGRDRYWVEVEPEFMAGSETKFGEGRDGTRPELGSAWV